MPPMPPKGNGLRLLAWETTRRCNLACAHCRMSAEAEAEAELSTEEGRVLLEEAAALGARLAILTGGEPLLREDLEDLVRAAVAAGLRPVVASNGALLDASRARALADAGAARIAISVESASREAHDARRGEGSFDAALAGLAAARAASLETQLNTTVTRANAAGLAALLDLAGELGASAHHFFFLVPTGRGATLAAEALGPRAGVEAMERLCDEAERRPVEVRLTCAPHLARVRRARTRAQGGACLAGKAYLFVAADGTVQPCGYLPVACGNARDGGLARVLEASETLAALGRNERSGECAACAFVRECGGCRARAHAVTGDLLGPDPACPFGPARRRDA